MARPPTITIGSGADQFQLDMAEDAYLGDAMFTVSVDGVQIGGAQTVVAPRDVQQTFVVQGNFGAGPHAVGIAFLNDAYDIGGDRNLYVQNIRSGVLTDPRSRPFFTEGTQIFQVITPPPPITVGSGPDAVTLRLSEDAYQGDAQFTLAIDGVQVGGVLTAQALHSTGQQQEVTLLGDLGYGPHTLTVTFLNDLYGGTPDTDRNLYVDLIKRGTIATGGQLAPLFATGARGFQLTPVPPPSGPQTIGTGPDSLVVYVSEDGAVARDGFDAQFTIAVDGTRIGGVNYAAIPHSRLQSQAFTVLGSFGAGPHTVTVDFLNDVYGGTPVQDRNLYVNSIVNGGLVTQLDAPLFYQGPRSFTAPAPAAVLSGSDLTGPAAGQAVLNGTPGNDTLVARGGGNTINGQGGTDVITGSEAGGDVIRVGEVGDGLKSAIDRITLLGPGNVVLAGDAAVTVNGRTSGSVVRLGNGADRVTIDGAGNTVFAGVGANVIAATGAAATIRISGFEFVYSDTVSISGDHNTVTTQVTGTKYPASGTVKIDGGTGYGTFLFGWGTGTLRTGGDYNDITIGGGTFDITAGSGHDTVTASGFPATPSGTIRLGGEYNTVKALGSTLTVVGGEGHGSFDFSGISAGGPVRNSVTTGGAFNVVSVQGGSATVDPGSGDDTVTLLGSNASLMFHGSGNLLFLRFSGAFGAGPAGAVVQDQSTGLQVYVESPLQSLDFQSFGAGGVIHLIGGAGGFTSSQQAADALMADGAGGAMLKIDTGSIHFAAGISLDSSRFAIG